MNPRANVSHPDEDTLELYVLRTLPESQVGAVEEHLLICSPCQEVLAETEDFIAAVKTATERLQDEQTQKAAAPSWRSFFTLPKPVWVAGFAAAAAMVVMVPMLRENNASVQAVALSVTRGETDAKAADAKPGRVQVKVDATGIEEKSGYSVEVVDENGSRVLETAAKRTGNSVAVEEPVKLNVGQYWVRLYDANSKAEPLREYSLLVR